VAAFAIILICACATVTTPAVQPAMAGPTLASEPLVTNPGNWPDTRSYAEPQHYVTRHLELDLDVDFAASRLRGTVTLDIEPVANPAGALVLDTQDLSIDAVEAARAGTSRFEPVKYTLAPADPIYGSALRIELSPDARRVRIAYATSPGATGLQWLAPQQTREQRLPFLYSQAQDLHARSFVPLQDTPRIRSTYTATLHVPQGLVAVMAAEADPANRRGATTFRFRMPQPIPSYLLALAVGDLDFRATGPRTGVWAEPSLVEAAAREFDDAENMLRQTEALYGPYRWGRYDVLVLPPSFPLGGMENPRLTFLTPTVITGDKSLVGVLAHELAHSWSGNLVTNATWRDGWLNEGFTTYFERRIMEAVYGKPRAEMEWGIGLMSLQRTLAELAPADAWRGVLAPDLAQHRTEEGSSVAYEKGALLLYQLERHCGRVELDRFLRGWFDTHAFTSVTTPELVRALDDDLFRRGTCRLDADFLHRWIDEPGLPVDALVAQSSAFDAIDAQRERWVQGATATSRLDTQRWTVQEWLRFLEGMARPQPVERLQELDSRFHLTGSPNAEIAHAWYRLAIASNYPGLEAPLTAYLTSIGRIKLIRPLYVDLMKTTQGAELARRIYATARPGYHAIARRSIDRVVK